MRLRIYLCAGGVLWALGAAGAAELSLRLNNTLDSARPNAVVVVSADALAEEVPPGAVTATLADADDIPVQADDLDGDGAADELVMVVDLGPSEAKVVTINTEAPWEGESFVEARTSWRYEQYAVLDTDRIAYGLYGVYAPANLIGGLQWDCYGKRPDAWKLCLDALESVNYHEDNPVAVDFLVIGSTLGLGGFVMGEGRPVGGRTAQFSHRVIANGPVRAGIQLDIADWITPAGGRYNASVRYFVHAHNDFIDARVAITPVKAKREHFGLGIRQPDRQDQFIGDKEQGILGLWGHQEEVVGGAGLALIFRPDDFHDWRFRDIDEEGYAVLLSPGMDELEDQEVFETRLWLLGVWEHGGMATEDTFLDYVQGLARRYNDPVFVTRL
jgi:hypothetical protein